MSQRGLVVAGVVAAHALLLFVWSASAPPRRAADRTLRVQLRLLPPPAPAAPPQALSPVPLRAPAPLARRTPRPPAAPAAHAPTPRLEPPPTATETVTATATQAPASASASASASAASMPSAAGLLDAAATRLAIRDAARQRGSGALAREQVGPDTSNDEQRLARGIERGAKGECLKGEYLGGGMGLLSLPFLAAAALRDQCRH